MSEQDNLPVLTFVGRVSAPGNAFAFSYAFKHGGQPLVDKAAQFVKQLDEQQEQTIAIAPIDMALRTVLTALGSAIDTQRWDTASESFVMLQQIEQHVRDEAKPRNPAGLLLDAMLADVISKGGLPELIIAAKAGPAPGYVDYYIVTPLDKEKILYVLRRVAGLVDGSIPPVVPPEMN